MDPRATSFYADFNGLASLKNSAGQQDPAALREAARQFESIFTQMMLKSMRAASLGESLLDNDQSKFYMDMFDNQMAVHLSKGKGLGLADLLVKQLQGFAAPTPDPLAKTERASVLDHASRATTAPIDASPVVTKSIPASAPPVTAPLSKVEAPKPGERKAVAEAKPAVAPVASSPDEFVAQMWPHAQEAGKELGVDPRTLIAHAALETGWGKAVPCNPDGSCSFNLFGIKATPAWQGGRIGVNTLEYEGGVAVRKRESFRAYASPAESFRDYAALLKNNGRYSAALGTQADAHKFAGALQRGGYATDPNYAQKLAATAASVVTRTTALIQNAFLKSDDARPLSVMGGVATSAVGDVVNRVATTVADRIGGGR